jgi:excisionase family DNA binding protein
MSHDGLLRAADVATTLCVSRSLAYQLMRNGDIPSVRIGHRSLRVRPTDLDAYIAAHVFSKDGCVPAKCQATDHDFHTGAREAA